MNHLRPYLVQAYTNAETWSELQDENRRLRQAIEESNRGVIIVKSNGRIHSCTDQARRWLATYCGYLPNAGEWLPAEVRRWFLQQHAQRTQTETPPQPFSSLMLKRENTQLSIRLLTDVNENQHTLLLEERTTRLTPTSLIV